MSKIRWDGTTLLAPVPATIVTCSDGTRANGLTIAWNGVVNSKPPMVYVSIRKERFSHDIIKNSGEFCVNLVGAKLLRAADTFGVRSGRDCDKFALCGIQPQYVEGHLPPIIPQSPISLMCKVVNISELPSHDMFFGEITDVFVADELLDDKGALKIERADLIAFAHGQYFTLGKRLASLGYSVRKKK